MGMYVDMQIAVNRFLLSPETRLLGVLAIKSFILEMGAF